MSYTRAGTWVIPALGTRSNYIEVGHLTIIAFKVPAAMSNTTFTFYGALTNPATDSAATVGKVHYEGSPVSITGSVGTWQSLDPAKLTPYRWIAVESGGAEAAERTLLVSYRDFT